MHVEDLVNPGETRKSQWLNSRMLHDYNDYCQFGKNKLVVGHFKIMLEEETGFVDFAANRFSIPRLGHQQAFQQGQSNLTYYSMSFGRIFLELQVEENEGFRVAASGVNATEFEDKTLETPGLPLHPNLLVAEVDSGKKIALQLLTTITALDQQYYTT